MNMGIGVDLHAYTSLTLPLSGFVFLFFLGLICSNLYNANVHMYVG
jgi:hypothetical protein